MSIDVRTNDQIEWMQEALYYGMLSCDLFARSIATSSSRPSKGSCGPARLKLITCAPCLTA